MGHIRRMAIPAGWGLFCNTIFNITDTFYAGWIGAGAQAALTVAFPLYFLQLSLCVGLMQAIAARAAREVGDGNRQVARHLAMQCVVLAGCLCLLVWFGILPFAPHMLSLLGAEGEVLDWGLEYVRAIFWGSPAFLGAFAFNGMLQAVGNTRAFRDSIAAAALFNVVLDPALMFGWFGLPALGMAGIGWATVFAQLGGALYMFYILSGSELVRGWRLSDWRLRPRLLAWLAGHLIAPTMRMLFINAGFFVIVAYLGIYGEESLAGYGIALRIEQLFLLPTIGMEAAMIAYCAQNFGAGRLRRVRAAYYLSLREGFRVVAAGALVMLSCGGLIMEWFTSDAAVLEAGGRYLYLAAASGPLYVLMNVAGALFLAGARHSIIFWVNILRLVVMPSILIYCLSLWWGLGVAGIWWSIFLCNVIAAAYMHWRVRLATWIAQQK